MFCKLTAGCITVAIVHALAFITMVTSMEYGLFAKMGFQEHRDFSGEISDQIPAQNSRLQKSLAFTILIIVPCDT